MLKYKKIPDWLIRQMLYNAHNPKLAKIRALFFKEEYAIFQERINNQEVLVAGSGLGHDAFVLANYNKRIVGIEIIKSFVEEARKRAKKLKIKNVEFHNADFLKLPYPDNYFDAVILNMGTIGNFDDQTRVIKNLLRIGKKLYFDFYIPGRQSLLIRKKMYSEESWSKLSIKGNKIVNKDGFESKSFSKRFFEKIVGQLAKKVSFSPIANFAYMAEVIK